LRSLMAKLLPEPQKPLPISIGKVQIAMMRCVKLLFPEYSKAILYNYKHPDLQCKDTKYSLELDVYIPTLSLALEYQGIQHYTDTALFGPQLSLQQLKDQQKKQLAVTKGITLIDVPYWWDRSKDSLAATIMLHRPGIVV
jgi:hypothetical protein